jgi:integrase
VHRGGDEPTDQWLVVPSHCSTPHSPRPATPRRPISRRQNALFFAATHMLSGYHVFRHNFASNLARAGKDQRVIDGFLGHQTEQMRKRYRHLYPDTKQDAIEAAFGSLPRLQLPRDGSVA